MTLSERLVGVEIPSLKPDLTIIYRPRLKAIRWVGIPNFLILFKSVVSTALKLESMEKRYQTSPLGYGLYYRPPDSNCVIYIGVDNDWEVIGC